MMYRSLLAALLLCTPAAAEDNWKIGKVYDTEELAEFYDEFHAWKKSFEKVYSSLEEEYKRMSIWVKNHEFIERHNAQNLSTTLGHNQFSDLTNDEFQKFNRLGPYSRHVPKPPKTTKTTFRKLSKISQIPDSLDWREAGAVTEVKNQGQCGSCWSFSTTGAIEAAKFLVDGELVSLSEQDLIDCDPNDYGCDGGLMDSAFEYLMAEGIGLCSEADYPYEAAVGECRQDSCDDVSNTAVIGYKDIQAYMVDAMLDGLNVQPISAAVAASSDVFQFYSSGVITGPDCGTQVDHAILAVGYGTDGDTDYFLVKNSWGSGWGENGYFRLDRNSSDDAGTCGILTMCSYPLV